ITVYWRLRYADAPSWMAAAISRIRSLPVGMRNTMKMSTTAKATATRPPATPYRTTFESTRPSTRPSATSAARSERVYEPSTEHAAPPPDQDPAEGDEPRHEGRRDEDDVGLVRLGQGEGRVAVW